MQSQQPYETDVLPTAAGDVTITFLGHGTLMVAFGNEVIHIDPYSRVADYARLPKATIVLITHEHQDHLDLKALSQVRTETTDVILTELCAQQVTGGLVMRNGDALEIRGIQVEAVPAYNVVHKRDSGQPFHPKGMGNGYVLTLGGKRLYVAGDTENTREMKQLQRIEWAFLPMNLPYTMTPAMVADAAKAFRPKILYPYHFGSTDTAALLELLKGEDIEVRIRSMA